MRNFLRSTYLRCLIYSATSVRTWSALYIKHFPTGSSRHFLWLPSQNGAFFVRPHAQIKMGLSWGTILIGPVALRRTIRDMVVLSLKLCNEQSGQSWTGSLRQIFFAKKSETFAKKNLTSKRKVVYSNGHGWRLLPAQHHRVGEANIQLRAQKMQA